MTKEEFKSALKVVGMIGGLTLLIVGGVTYFNDKYFVEKLCTKVETHVVYVSVTPTVSPSPVLLPSGKASPVPLKATSSAATSAVKQ